MRVSFKSSIALTTAATVAALSAPVRVQEITGTAIGSPKVINDNTCFLHMFPSISQREIS